MTCAGKNWGYVWWFASAFLEGDTQQSDTDGIAIEDFKYRFQMKESLGIAEIAVSVVVIKSRPLKNQGTIRFPSFQTLFPSQTQKRGRLPEGKLLSSVGNERF